MENTQTTDKTMMHEGKMSSDMKAGCCETKGMCDGKGGCSDMKADCCSTKMDCCNTKMDCCTMKKGCCGGSCSKHVVMIIVALIVVGGAFLCGMHWGRNSMRHYGMDRGNMMGNDNMRAMYECMMTDGATREKCTDMMKTMMQGNMMTTTGTR